MKAQSGDWLIVHSHTDGGHVRKAEILGTKSEGQPPYTVRWLDEDKESVVFPGPDAQVVAGADQAEFDRLQSERIGQVQADLGNQHRHGS